MTLTMEISYAKWKDSSNGKMPDLDQGIQVYMYKGSRYQVEIKKYPLTVDGFEIFRKDIIMVKGYEPLRKGDIKFNRIGEKVQEFIRNGLKPIVRW